MLWKKRYYIILAIMFLILLISCSQNQFVSFDDINHLENYEYVEKNKLTFEDDKLIVKLNTERNGDSYINYSLYLCSKGR